MKNKTILIYGGMGLAAMIVGFVIYNKTKRKPRSNASLKNASDYTDEQSCNAAGFRWGYGSFGIDGGVKRCRIDFDQSFKNHLFEN